ncbi:MAG TPA: response regulator [Candidatus Dormibacteraeota bacterium]|jgi:DNA-binding NarL/FixJ family response regulator|nr:response regulator [Candidatus Dormibacteraeota bacterium]
MPAPSRVVLLSDDLMFQSQLAAAVRSWGGTLLTARAGDLPEADAVFVDLNREPEPRLGAITRLREARPETPIVAFCHHGEKRLREQAMSSGASSCVTNGAIQATALRMAGLPVPGEARGD